MKKILSLVLALCMICTLLPATALTASAAEFVFELGANKNTTTHADGSSATTYSETVGGYTLSITDGSKMYKGANDAKGNSCIKLGTSSAVGGFNFTVPSDVTSVKIAVAKYKTNTTKVTINGTTTTLTKNSNNGEYDIITVDTTSTKTVSLTTVTGGVRAMVNTITFVVADSEPACEHESVTTTVTKTPTCTAAGEEEWECDDCGETGTNTIPAIGHSWEVTGGYDATCTEPGLEEQTCKNCGNTQEKELPVVPHNYEDGECTECGEPEPSEVVATITFDANKTQRTEYSTTKQVWENDGVIFTNNKAASTTNVADYGGPVRLYASSNIVVNVPENSVIKTIVVICGSTTYANALKNSAGSEATVSGSTVTITPAADADTYTIAKLTAQVRINSLTVTYEVAQSGEEECQHENTEVIPAKDATCTEPGNTAGLECSDCGAVITEPTEIPATGHTYENGVCACGAEKNTLVTDVADLKIGDRIVIVAKNANVAMSTNQKDNNRGVTTVKKDGDMVVGADMQVLTLKAGMVDGTFALHTGNGYLYAPSSSSNQLKTDDVKTANGSWTIEIDENGAATIKAQGDSTRNWLRYNSSSSLFACYEKDQGDVAIYKLVNSAAADAAVHTYVSGSETVAKDYANFSDALTATKGTLTLQSDVAADEVSFENVVLNLNGYTLTAGAIAVDDIMDSSNGKGLIKVDAQSAELHTALENQLVLWDNTDDASGYRVFDYKFVNLGIDADKDENEKDEIQSEIAGVKVVSFWSYLEFTNSNAYVLAGTSGLNAGFRLDWNGTSKTFKFDEAATESLIAEWANAELTEADEDYGFYITVTGFEGLDTTGDLVVTPIIANAFDTIATENATTYTVE